MRYFLQIDSSIVTYNIHVTDFTFWLRQFPLIFIELMLYSSLAECLHQAKDKEL